MKEEAIKYLSHGFSVIPVRQDKKPLIKWEPYRKRKAEPEELEEWWDQWSHANIAIVTGSISGICVIDIDSKDGFSNISAYVKGLKMPVANTPRGGNHLYFQTPDAALSNNTGIIPGCDFRGEGGYIIAPPSVGAIGRHYTWQQGLSLLEVMPPSLPEAYITYINKSIYSSVTTNKTAADTTTAMFSQGRRDNDLFRVANHLIKSGMPLGEARQVLEKLANNCSPPFPLDELEVKIESVLKRSQRRENSISDELQRFIGVTNGYFSVTDCYTALHTVTDNRTAVRVALHRLCEKGMLERHPSRDGLFRRIESDVETIEWWMASEEIWDVKWPFRIEDLVNIRPRNIIIIAGEQDAGKTAFLLNFVRMNMHRHPNKIIYFSSEMGGDELKSRLRNFEVRLDREFWPFQVFDRSSNFKDVIKPDAINIIDFLEVVKEPWMVGEYIKDIFDKLRKGIAIIAIQKSQGKEFGRGGDFGMEKARLYLTISRDHTIKILKAKNWVDPTVNPNGLQIKFKLAAGCKFITEGEWSKK